MDPTQLVQEASAPLRPLGRQLSYNGALELYNHVGHLLDDFSQPVIMADALVPDCPIVGASKAFEELTGYKRDEILSKNCRIMFSNVPNYKISRSVRQDLRSMITMCRLIGLSDMGGTSCVQTNRHRDGQEFTMAFAVSLFMLEAHPFLIGVQSSIGEGQKVEKQRVRAEHLSLLEQVRLTLEREAPRGATPCKTSQADFLFPRCRRFEGNHAFSPQALTDRVILLHDRRTVMRREAAVMPNSCVVMGVHRLRWTAAGLFFSVRVENVVQSDKWASMWPMLGFTRISPEEMAQKGYPNRAEWCGSSVCAGGEFEAFTREQEDHLALRFGAPSPDELRRHEGPFPRWDGSKTVPWKSSEGDVFGLLYTHTGHLHLALNYETVFSVDVGVKPNPHDDYYALVDCRGNVSELTLLPYEAPVIGLIQELGLQPQIDRKAMQTCVNAAVPRALKELRFAVTIADPSLPDVPLVGVSEEFEKMTGFNAAEILGQNCRFLNYGCPVQLRERAALRLSCQTGQPFTAILQNRRQSGESFANLLSLRGLRVARDVETGEDIWYLVAIQADVTELALESGGRLPQEENGMIEPPAELIEQLAQVSASIGKELRKEFASIASADRSFKPRMHPESDADVALDSSVPQIVIPASKDRQNAPKPLGRTAIALLSEAEWMECEGLTVQQALEAMQASVPRRKAKRPFPNALPLALSAGVIVALASLCFIRRYRRH